MKEAFELIKERLEEKEMEHAIDGQQYGADGFYNLETDQRNVMQGIKEALSIVSEVEAECGNGREKKLYKITLEGCDDETIFEIELAEKEYQFLLRVSEIANKTSYYGCMPRMYVEPYKPTND